jgi:hypothetical protein
MFERLFKRKAKIDERRREMALEANDRRFGQELLNMRLQKFLASQKSNKPAADDKFSDISAMRARPDHA